MEAILNKENQKLTVAVSGRLDSNTVPELECLLKKNFTDTNELVFDFLNLEYISSAGLRVLLATHKYLSGNVKIINTNQTVKDIITLTGMKTFLNVE